MKKENEREREREREGEGVARESGGSYSVRSYHMADNSNAQSKNKTPREKPTTDDQPHRNITQ